MSWLTNCVRTYHTVLADIKAFCIANDGKKL